MFYHKTRINSLQINLVDDIIIPFNGQRVHWLSLWMRAISPKRLHRCMVTVKWAQDALCDCPRVHGQAGLCFWRSGQMAQSTMK